MGAKQKEHKEKEETTEEELIYTKFEKARMIGSRALQLSMGAPFLLKFSSEELEKLKYDPIAIALMEFNEGILPITVKRPKMRE